MFPFLVWVLKTLGSDLEGFYRIAANDALNEEQVEICVTVVWLVVCRGDCPAAGNGEYREQGLCPDQHRRGWPRGGCTEMEGTLQPVTLPLHGCSSIVFS